MLLHKLVFSGAIVLGIGVAGAACIQTDSFDNDKTTGAFADAGSDVEDESADNDDSTTPTTPVKVDASKPAVKDAGRPAVNPPTNTGEGGGDEGPGTGTETTESDAAVPSTGSDSGSPTPDPTDPEMTDPPETAPPEPMMSVIAGTAISAKCTSYGKPKGGKCGSWYCGVTEEQIAAELPADSLCNDAADACDASLVLKVGSCARDALTNWTIGHLGQKLTDAEAEKLRPTVQTCVYKDAAIKAKVTEGCLGCFLDAAQCAGVHCTDDCALGDSANCDKCRLKNNCDQPAPGCAKLPTPF